MGERSRTYHDFVVPIPRPGATSRLFLLHHAGGFAAQMLPLARGAPPEVEAILVELPGRGARFSEPFESDWRAVCARLAEGVFMRSDKPIALLGHSMGGLLAYEVATLLQERFRRSVAALVVSACHPPEHLVRLALAAKMTDVALLAQLRRYGGTPSEVLESPELLEIVLAVLRADLALLDTYAPAPRAPLDCPIVAIGGDADKSVSEDELGHWRRLTRGGFEQRSFPGNHFYLFQCAEQIFAVLGRVLPAAGPIGHRGAPS